MPTASSSARPAARIAAAFAAAAAAAWALAPAPPAVAAEGGGKGAPGGATCVICHTGADYAAGFSHRGLEESADGCATCHGDGTAHVAARGGKGNILQPAAGSPRAERELCLQCHEEEVYAAPKHLAPEGKEARCTSCHDLHGGAPPVRGGPAADLRPALPGPGAGPGKGRPFARGRVEAGWRWVGGEEGRYDQDVDLGQGPRLLGVDAEAGLDDGDPLGPRAAIRATGLGDPHESLRLRARKSDDWILTLAARRDEHPFVAQEGLHGGESLRTSLAAAADLRLSPVARLGAGWDYLDTEGTLRGTLFDDGVVVPVATRADRKTREGWGSLALRGRDWRVSVRQSWLEEDGDDGRERRRSAPGVPDFLSFEDTSRMVGPRTSVAGGIDLLDGRLSLEARGSRAALERDVDTEEIRRGTLLSGPYTRRVATDGARDRVVDMAALDASLALSDAWALEAGVERRALREEGSVHVRTSLDTGGGPVLSGSDAEADLSQRILEERAALRWRPSDALTLRGGGEFLTEDLRDDGRTFPDGTVRSRGAFASAEARPAAGTTLRGSFRTAHASDAFTPLTPRDRDTWRLAASFRDEEGWRTGADWRHSRIEARESGLGARGQELRIWGGMGKEEAFTADLSFTLRKQSLSVDTLSFVGSSLEARDAASLVRSHLLDLRVGLPLVPRLRLEAGGNWVLDRGSLPVRALDLSAGLRWEISRALAARVQVRRREYDEMGADALDYSVDILEVAIEYRF